MKVADSASSANSRGVGLTLARRSLENRMEINSAIEQFTYIGDVHDDDLRCKLSLFSAVVSELLFDDLRGKEQLGYIVRFLSSFAIQV
jgi:insulysin